MTATMRFSRLRGTSLSRLPRMPRATLSAPRTRFGTAIALTFLAFFVCNKQAFCNYYFFLASFLLTCLVAPADV